MKKIFAIIIVIALIAALIFGFISMNGGKKEEKAEKGDKADVKEEVIISFDTDGGEKIEDIKIEKGKTTTLPTTKKEGFDFKGWYLEEEKIEDSYVFDKDTTLKAKWEAVKEEIKYFTVSFDSQGGSAVNSIKVECNKPLPTLSKPTKTGYNFVSWADKNGKVIGSGASLSCEDVKLYANWEKVEEKKTYTCENGTLSGTKCLIEGTIKEKCEGERVFEHEGKCVTITNSARQEYQRGCKKEHITYMSYAGETEGKVVNWGVWGCAYYKTNDTSKSNCESHQFTWVTPENACYVKWISNSTINTCEGNYVAISNPNQFSGVNGLNGGCFPTTNKTKYCDDGYTLTDNKCIKTVDAKLK